MDAYGKILLFAMPAFLLLVLFEKLYGYLKGNDTVQNMDMISSLSSGITNATKDVLGLSVAIISYEWLVNNIAIIHLQATWLLYLIAFISLDFAGYWTHRIAHTINFFWNNHIIHHSSEEFNLACALRQSISVFVKLFIVFLLPAALLGVPQQVIAIVAPIHLFAQFWYHTQHINKLGFLEKLIVTPSLHRVHHAINEEYIDKNYSQIFIIWDKLFNTYQEEIKTVPAVYGITIPVQTWNPIKINFQHLLALIKDAWQTKSLKDKLKIWFMPTGWRPNDVAKKSPFFKINDVYHFEKYNPSTNLFIQAWSWFQILITLLFASYLFGNIVAIGMPNIFWYGSFLFVSIYSYTELMDGNKRSIIFEIFKNSYGFLLFVKFGGWFGLTNKGIEFAILFYFVFSTLVVYIYCVKHLANKGLQQVNNQQH